MIDGENRKRKNGSKKTIVAWRWNLCVAKKKLKTDHWKRNNRAIHEEINKI